MVVVLLVTILTVSDEVFCSFQFEEPINKLPRHQTISSIAVILFVLFYYPTSVNLFFYTFLSLIF